MNSIQFLEMATHAMTSSDDAYEMCRNFVHTDFTGAKTLGAQILIVDQKGQLREAASYGKTEPLQEDLSVWDNHELSRAISQKEVFVFPHGEYFFAVFPFYKTLAPVGALLLTTELRWDPKSLDTASSRIMAQLGAFYLDSNGLAIRKGAASSDARPEDVTERQRQILLQMSQGLTNAEIARNLMLSESTIRQETVRIYRALGVGSRSEASRKGKALGLIPKSTAGELIA